MQSLIEDVIRWFGYYALRLVTWGRYSGGREGDRLAEGAIGFGILTATTYAAYILVHRLSR